MLHRFEQHLGGARLGLVLYSLVFGAGHVIQGWDVAIVTALLGLAWGIVFLWRRSVVAPSSVTRVQCRRRFMQFAGVRRLSARAVLLLGLVVPADAARRDAADLRVRRSPVLRVSSARCGSTATCRSTTSTGILRNGHRARRRFRRDVSRATTETGLRLQLRHDRVGAAVGAVLRRRRRRRRGWPARRDRPSRADGYSRAVHRGGLLRLGRATACWRSCSPGRGAAGARGGRPAGRARHAAAAAVAAGLGTPLLFYMYVAPGLAHATSAFAVAAFVLAWLACATAGRSRGLVVARRARRPDGDGARAGRVRRRRARPWTSRGPSLQRTPRGAPSGRRWRAPRPASWSTCRKRPRTSR